MCFDCLKEATKYEECCEKCVPCDSCFQIHSQSLDSQYLQEEIPIAPQQDPCSLCKKLVCSERIHQILDCELAEEPTIYELKEYFLFLRKEILELKVHLFKVKNLAEDGKKDAYYATKDAEHVEHKLQFHENSRYPHFRSYC